MYRIQSAPAFRDLVGTFEEEYDAKDAVRQYCKENMLAIVFEDEEVTVKLHRIRIHTTDGKPVAVILEVL